MSDQKPQSSNARAADDLSRKKAEIKYHKHINLELARKIFIVYGFCIALVVTSLVMSILLIPFIGNTASFLLFFPAVTLSSWYGGLKPGVFASVLAAFCVNYFSFPLYPLQANLRTSLLLQTGIFLLGGVLLSFVIDQCRRTNVIEAFEKREKEQNRLLMRLLEENARAREEVKARDEFLSIASHELKTPLTSMLLKLQTALHNVRNVSLANFSVENLLKMLESAEQQSKRLSKMINDLLNVSLITSGRLELEREDVDLSQITKNIVDRFSEKLDSDGVSIRLEAKTPVVGTWDKLRIEQVITNLVSNAIKYGNGKPFEIHVTRHHLSGKLTIRDHGSGIHQSEQKKIFGRFERGTTSHTKQGLGVGLYITQQIVKAHGGTIRLNSRLGVGSEFIVELPLKSRGKERA